MTPQERFWAKVQKGKPDECWPWLAGVGARGGPVFNMSKGGQVSARRACWLFVHGVALDNRHQVTPTCGTVDCLNPAHLALKPWGDVEARFWAKVQKTDGCWLWTGAKFRNGYGAFRMNGFIRHAARVSWEFANGPIEGHDPSRNETCIVIQHRCDNPPCVRPEHLELGTYLSNTRDMIAKGRAGWQKKRAAAVELNTCNPEEKTK